MWGSPITAQPLAFSVARPWGHGAGIRLAGHVRAVPSPGASRVPSQAGTHSFSTMLGDGRHRWPWGLRTLFQTGLCWHLKSDGAPHGPVQASHRTTAVPGGGQGGQHLPVQSSAQQTSAGDIPPDTGRGLGATAKGRHGASGLQAGKVL